MDFWIHGLPEEPNAHWSNLYRNIYACREVEFLELVHGLGGGLDNVEEPFVRALLEGLLRFLVAMRRALHSKPLDTSRQGNRSGDTRTSALDGIRDVAGGLVYDTMVIGLQSNANALSSHTKNNFLLMV